MTRYGLVLDSTKCIGCNICITACKDEHVGNDHLPWSRSQPETLYTFYKELPPGSEANVPNFTYTPGHNWLDVLEIVRGRNPWLDVRFLPYPCMMCENAPCMEAFPDQIYMRPDGIVIIDPEVPAPPEIVDSCPYGVIYYNEEFGIGQKDTWDVHLIEEGKNPKFVDACPLRIFKFGDLDDPTSEVAQLVASGKAKPLSPEWGTRPKVFYIGAPTPTVAGHLMCSKSKMDVRGAAVTLTNLFTGDTMMTRSNYAGNFRFDDLGMAGLYIVRIEAPSYYPRARMAYLKGDGFSHLGRVKLYPK
jgi:Fe-S-cluster-containing dehydrogenase component